MAEGRSMSLWNHTSALLAATYNVNRDPKRCPAFDPSDFNPHFKGERGVGPEITVDEFADEMMKVAAGRRPKQG